MTPETVTLMLFLATSPYSGDYLINTVVIPNVDVEHCETIGTEYLKRHAIHVGFRSKKFTEKWSYFTCLPTTLETKS